MNGKEDGWLLNWEVNRRYLKGLVVGKFKTTFSKNGIMPSVSIQSSQLQPLICTSLRLAYLNIVEGGFNFANGSLNLGFKKEHNVEARELGYGLHFGLSHDSLTVNPQILYPVNPDLTLSVSLSIKQTLEVTAQVGMNYMLTASKGASVFLVTTHKEWSTALSASQLVLVYNHNGYLLKLPLTLTDDSDNTSSVVMSGLITLGANALAYGIYRLIKSKRGEHKKRELKVAYAKYQSKLEKVNEYLHENKIFYESSLNTETRNLGLVITEAYYGLADHIYRIEAGTLIYKFPQNESEYG